ncbi:MAG: hypothetical protein PHH17_01625 [Candidatus Pacebacteria bacterium]|jgi:hypothetical protein|nr:hypothetical protein [Candidatus Paceibacterota bacterium]MDD3072385.1 hypothetical protein [Candidatus Paceibacterota bacterium]MDD3728998.1 hypothetical protein [Candidatus Paceibacterota bacterium]MDD4201631.1 hypothetical protein [Candidatus Paceibacterota bacterium]MDD4467228.1 hypothetical protein [Candidatus Paceibacterota bacterium]
MENKSKKWEKRIPRELKKEIKPKGSINNKKPKRSHDLASRLENRRVGQ